MLISSLSTADVYKWVGDDGKTNYTQLPPPPGVESEIVRKAHAPSVSPAPPATELLERFEEEQKDRENDATVAEQEKKYGDIRRLNCDAATGNLALLEEQGQRRYVTADGKYIRPSEEERQELIDQAKQQIKEFCTE